MLAGPVAAAVLMLAAAAGLSAGGLDARRDRYEGLLGVFNPGDGAGWSDAAGLVLSALPVTTDLHDALAGSYYRANLKCKRVLLRPR